ncbi:endo-1,4-beta xylanase [Cristinia sonorae]|uniref:Beta-xylanase n=1 Tax=Cristinia sonorae TaxID=1940300 RepID=A0A8K0UQ84_9AGAR|nr:endo-1,4-beta xylanase [Cristinia sonorae]
MVHLLATLLALVTVAACSPTFKPKSKPELNTIAKQHRKLYFGTATDNPELNDTAYRAILDDNRMFGQITPANSMKWFATEPSPGEFTFHDGDVIANLAKKNRQLLRGHNCVWHNQLPDWVSTGTFTEKEILAVVERHCETLVRHYRGQVYAWDVINEVFNDDGTFRQDVFFNSSGSKFIPTAFHAARRADPHAKLYANDFNIEGPNAKSAAYQNLIKTLKKEGVPIDGIGFQSHFIVGELPPNIKENMEAFTKLGVEVAVTELDVRMTLPETPELLAQQRKDYETVISVCQAVKGCIGVTVWDFTDKFSWVPGTFAGQGAACPWDENLKEKPGFFGIIDGFN